MTPATRLELTLETVGAVMAAPLVVAFYWTLGTQQIVEGGDLERVPREMPSLLAGLYEVVIGAIREIVGFLPNLIGLHPPDWYLIIALGSAAASTTQFRVLREFDLVPNLPKPAQYALGALFVVVAGYTWFGLAALLINYLRLSFAWRVWMHGTDEAASSVAAPAMNAFYFLFVFAIASVAFYVLNVVLAGLE